MNEIFSCPQNNRKFQAIFSSPDSYFTETRRWVLLVCVNTILRVLVLFT